MMMSFEGVREDISENGSSQQALLIYQSYQSLLELMISQQQMIQDLLAKNQELSQKNAGLLDILELVEVEKKKLKENVSNNVETLVIPALNQLEGKTRKEKKTIGIIEEHLKDLTSSFGVQLSLSRHRLSPRESEISNLVREGQSNRDIANSLNISIKTVETIRNKIRRKLGLVNKRVNLTSYFRNA